MATLDDIVESNILNAEYLQNISELQKDQYKEQVDTANSMGSLDNRFKEFFKGLERQRSKNEETLRESGGSGGGGGIGQGGSESTFKKVAGAGAGIGVGMAALGFGIGGFFTGLAAGDKALTWMNTDLTKLTSVMKTLTDGFAEMNTDGLLKVGGLLAAGGAMGALLGPGRSMKAGFGMFMLGAGIGGFFAGLAAGDAAASYLSADGVAIKNIMVNLAEGLGAFAGRDLAALGALLATGGLLGATRGLAGPAATGIGLLGVGIGAFFGGIAVIGEFASVLGADGSGMRDIMVNLGTGLAALSNDDINMFKLAGFFGAATSVAAGITALTATELVAGLGNFVSKIFTDSNEPSVFERIANDLQILSSLDTSNLAGFDTLSKSLFQLGDGIDKIANANMGDFKRNIENLGKSIAFAIPIFDRMWNGGLLGEGYFDGYSQVDFGKGLKNSPISEISSVMTKAAEIPIGQAVERGTMSSVESAASNNVTVINNNTNAPTNVSNQTSMMNGGGDLPSATMSNGTRSDAYAAA
jgi:hypothetical protein